MTGASRPVDLTGTSGQQSIQTCSREIKIREVEEIIESHAGLKDEPLVDCVRPTGFQVDSAQPGKIDFAGRCERHGWGHSSKLLQLLQSE
jgi:hypothetical protein